MGKKKNTRSRRRGGPSAGSITLQYAAADNVASYSTINITTLSLGFPIDRPARVNWVRMQFACVPDATVSDKDHVPLIQFEVKAPSGSTTPRMLYRSPPSLVPLGPIRVFRARIPNSGFYQYNTSQTVVLTMIVSASASLAVTFNVFVNISIDYKSYQGLSLLHPPGSGFHQKRDRRDDDDDDVSSAFSALSLAC